MEFKLVFGLTCVLSIYIIKNTIYHTKWGEDMSTQKIAITVPPIFLQKLDAWARKTRKSRSRFIVEEMAKRLGELEDDEITRLYNQAYSDPEDRSKDSELAEAMFADSAVHEMEDKW
jgi:hypothetical protein